MTSYYRLGVTIGGLVVFAAGIFCCSYPVEYVGIGIATVLFIAFQINFPFKVVDQETTLAHILGLGVGMLYNFPLGLYAVTLGIIGGTLISWARTASPFYQLFKNKKQWLDLGFLLGINLIPLAFVWVFSEWSGSSANYLISNTQILARIAIILLGFSAIHSILFITDYYFRKPPKSKFFHPGTIFLSLVNILTLPFVIITVQAYPFIHVVSFSVLAGTLTAIEILFFALGESRTRGQRQVEELATLNRVSRALQSTLGINELLPVIHQQVTDFLGIDNFYVALYDQDKNEIWYPLAVKHNQRQNWSRRPMENRLTDRVIKEGKPILLTPKNKHDSDYIGLPSNAETLEAWMGVPLITSEHTLGCLAVMGFSKDVNFTTDDLNLLSTLSGQVSVAIENTLLYENIQKRASQLERLNQLSQAITASLDIDHVLSQICDAAQQVGESDKSAVYLLNEDRTFAALAYSNGLSSELQNSYHSFSITQEDDEKALNFKIVEIISDTSEISLSGKYRDFIQEEGIKALMSFPLKTIEGQVGFLQIYFDTIQSFPPQQLNILWNFASQASLAISNARLYANTDQALSRRVQQLSILEKIGRELAAELDLDRLFDLILQFALKFTKVTVGGVAIFDKQMNYLELKVHQSYTHAFSKNVAMIGIVGRVARTKQVQNVPDVRLDEDYYEIFDGSTRSQLSVPILHNERFLGVISLESPHLEAFSESDQTFISQLAAQAAIAMINAELYQEAQERLNEQILLYQFSRQITGTLAFRPLLETILDAMSSILRPAAAGIYRWNPDEERYLLSEGVTLDETSQKHLPEQLTLAQATELTTEKNIVESGLTSCKQCQQLGFYLTTTQQPLAFALFHLPVSQIIPNEEHKLLETMAIQGAITLQSAQLFSNATWERDRLDTVLDSVGEAILMIDKDGRVLLANERIQPLADTKLDEIIGVHFTQLPTSAQTALGLSDDKVTPLEEIWSGTHTSWPMKETYKIKRPNFERILERGIFPIGEDQNDTQGKVIVLRDITEEIHIRQDKELISETLVHDLRSPTSAILGALDLMEDILPDDQNKDILVQSLKVARRSTMRVLQLIRSLLDISRLSSGNLELILDFTNICDVVNDLLIEFIPQANQVGVILQNNIQDNLPRLWVDVDKMKRVVSNLIDNAIKFTPEGGKVILSAAPHGENELLFQVRDTGPGVPVDYREKIFERFAQVPGTRGRRRGSGLGLTFCLLAVEAHGGKVWVDDHPEGGSIFSFILPIEGPQPDGEQIIRRSYLANDY
ncbi:MAG: GAF domain-containing protein [Chloroflexota bacterium]|nr:GAF domain-containing protein [Chloroflexota bacterium]